MGEDRYRLGPVRDARERTEAVRKGALAGAIDDARTTEARLATARRRTEAAGAALAAAIATGATAAELARAEQYRARLRRDLAATRDEELRAATRHDATLGVVDHARATLGHARADREVIERHFAAWRETQRKLRERRED